MPDNDTWGLSDPEVHSSPAPPQAAAAPVTWGMSDPEAQAQPAKAVAPDPATLPKPVAPPPSGVGAVATTYLDNLAAGAQGVSPYAAKDAVLAPANEQWKFAELGEPSDATKYVALRNPDTGQYSVYNRTPDMGENRMAAAGRALALGVPEGWAQPATAAMTPSQSLLQDFGTAGVTPNLPAVGQGRTAGIVSQVAKSLPLVGPAVRSAANQALGDTAVAADRMANAYGDAQGPLDAGEAIQSGVTNFAKGQPAPGMTPSDIIAQPTRMSGFGSKSAALYDRFANSMDQTAPLPMPNTLAALQGPMARFPSSPELGQALTNPKLQQFLTAVGPNAQLTFPELQEFRSSIGRAISDPSLVADIPRADLKNVYSGMSKDMETAAAAQGPDALNAFQRANQYYAAGINRVDQLEPLLSGSPEQAFAKINRAAGTTGGADAGLLVKLQRSMAPDDWGDVGAGVIRQLGKPTASAESGEGFSPTSFATNWTKLSPQAKDTLFGANAPGSTRESLEALANVAQAQKNTMKLANSSHTAEHLGMGALAVGAMDHASELMAHPILTAAGMALGAGTGKALMSPGFAQWLYRAPQMIAQAPNSLVGTQRAMAQLDGLAQFSPALQPYAAKMRQALVPAQPQ